MCRVLNCLLWPVLSNDGKGDENELRLQLQSVTKSYNHFREMDCMKQHTIEDVANGYIDIVHYCQRYFNISNVDRLTLRKKVLDIGDGKENWLGTILILEICLCSPRSYATME